MIFQVRLHQYLNFSFYLFNYVNWIVHPNKEKHQGLILKCNIVNKRALISNLDVTVYHKRVLQLSDIHVIEDVKVTIHSLRYFGLVINSDNS